MASNVQEPPIPPGFVLLAILAILALNTIFDPGLPAHRRAWDRSSPFACLYQTVQQFGDISCSFLLQNRREIFLWCGPATCSSAIFCLNIAALIAFASLMLFIEGAPWVKAFGVIYMANWALSHIETPPLSSRLQTGARQAADYTFAVLVHTIACFTTFSDIGTASLWSTAGLLICLIAAFFFPRFPTPPWATNVLPSFGVLAGHWFFLMFSIFAGHGPMTIRLKHYDTDPWPSEKSVEERLKSNAVVQQGALALFDVALLSCLFCHRDRRRMSRWEDFPFAVLVLASGVLWFGWIHPMYAIFGPFPAASIKLPFW